MCLAELGTLWLCAPSRGVRHVRVSPVASIQPHGLVGDQIPLNVHNLWGTNGTSLDSY